MEMFTLLKDNSISSLNTSIFSGGCKRKSISSKQQLQIVPDYNKYNDSSDEDGSEKEIKEIKENKKIKITHTTTNIKEINNNNNITTTLSKEIKEKHNGKEWNWKAAAQAHYSNDVHSKFLGKQNKTKSIKSITNSSKITTSPTTSRLEQTVIDAGQKNVGQMVCNKCKMLYSYGSKEDEAAHQSFCNGNIQQQKVILKNWKSFKILNSFSNGQSIIVISKDNISSNSLLQSKMNQLKEIVNNELGYSSKKSNTNSNIKQDDEKENEDDEDNEEKIFLYLDSNGRVIGCLIAERVEKGYRIETSTPTIQCSKESSKILCGVNRIWVLPSARKRGIASKLMESLASNMYYCYHLKKNEIATTQPSTTGLLFFNNYFKTNQFLLYKINK